MFSGDVNPYVQWLNFRSNQVVCAGVLCYQLKFGCAQFSGTLPCEYSTLPELYHLDVARTLLAFSSFTASARLVFLADSESVDWRRVP